jgi:hypothetical protein
MGKKRWEGTPEEERKAEMEKVRSHIDLTPEERTAIGRTAVNARWAKWRAEHPVNAGEAKSGTAKPARRTKKKAGSPTAARHNRKAVESDVPRGR